MEKKLFGLVAVVIVVSSLLSPFAYADEDDDNNGKDKKDTKISQPIKSIEKAIEKLEKFEIPTIDNEDVRNPSMGIGASGRITMNNAEVTAVTSTTDASSTVTTSQMTVRVWGLLLTVNVSGAKLVPEGTTFSQVAVGHRVNVTGTIDATTGGVKATHVRDISLKRNAEIDALKARIAELLKRLQDLQARLGLPQ